MTPQTTFMITAPIDLSKEAALRELLASMNQLPGMADPTNSLVPFHQFSRLHVARFVIIEALTNDDIRAHDEEPAYWPPTLGFIGDIDGREDTFLAELAVRAWPGLRQIFAHCLGFDPEQTNLLAWMRQNSRRPTANYINWRGRTVIQVHEERALAEALRGRLPKALGESVNGDSQAIRRHLVEFAQGELAAKRLRLTPPERTPPGWWLCNLLHLVGVPLALLVLSPLIFIGLPFSAFHLRTLEKSDPENTRRPDRAHLKRITRQEDFLFTNQFNVFGQVKPGRFRRYTIRALLLVLDYAARHVYKRGYLTRIRTIHFARWVLLDDDRRVYFASNYDGSAESYMDDFINKVAWGLNLVFSNGVGYPRTRWLIKGGAEFEGKYKRTLRRNQFPSESWYIAYPGLSAVDLARNSRIREGLEARGPRDADVRAWLSLI